MSSEIPPIDPKNDSLDGDPFLDWFFSDATSDVLTLFVLIMVFLIVLEMFQGGC